MSTVYALLPEGRADLREVKRGLATLLAAGDSPEADFGATPAVFVPAGATTRSTAAKTTRVLRDLGLIVTEVDDPCAALEQFRADTKVVLLLPGASAEKVTEARRLGQVVNITTGAEYRIPGELALPPKGVDMRDLLSASLPENVEPSDWDILVASARYVMQIEQAAQWRLGELASVADVQFGRMADFASELGLPVKTLQAYEQTHARWAVFDRYREIPFSVARELGKIDSREVRERLWTDEPCMTVSRAEELVKEHRGPRPAARRQISSPSADRSTAGGNALTTTSTLNVPDGDDLAAEFGDAMTPDQDAPSQHDADRPVLVGVVIPPLRGSVADDDSSGDEDDDLAARDPLDDDEKLRQAQELRERIVAIDTALNTKVEAGLDEDRLAAVLSVLEHTLEAIQAL